MAGVSGDCPTIKAITKGVIHRICSGQVILDLSAAVKELVENSLDAGATSVEISLKEYGEQYIKVTDNGCGISPKNFQVLALKHHTSKISNFPDLQSLTTFGFRGEALSSLCALGSLSLETRTKNEPVGTHLTFDQSGIIKSERKIARQVGTTVTIENLFSTLPVRRKEFSRNIRREYGKLVSLLNAYALVAKGVRFVCTNTTGKNAKSVVLKTQGSSSLKDNIINTFGLNTFTCLEPLSLSVSEAITVEGFLSKPRQGTGRNLGDRQFFYVNGRPVDMPKVGKLVNELYKSSNSKQYPIVILNIIMPTQSYDVNVTPDKRKIFFSDECFLISSLREEIEKIYSPGQCGYTISKIESIEEMDANDSDTPDSGNDLPTSARPLTIIDNEQLEAGSCQDFVSDDISSKMIEVIDRDVHGDKVTSPIRGEIPVTKKAKYSAQDEQHEILTAYQCTQSRSSHASPPGRLVKCDVVANANSSSGLKFVQSSLTKFVDVKKRKDERSVIGQFNLGFIIGKLDQDLFIVDQHAADEKYNFERLARSTILSQQPLLKPLRLELSPEEEVIAFMHTKVIRENGFSLVEDVDAPPGLHFLLTAVPFSKNMTFGVEDVKELISILSDAHGECSIISSYKMDTQDSLCPSRVRSMLASRACRSSIMIGDPLAKNEMQKIVQNLAGLKSPWNCPHGRPTMRHLVDLTSISAAP
ncbi:unnamed protein product [Spirodela intermedia]|uniref:Uncharacterized protein n=1 Tax=Spirodela intermedia TaxID=51605 RepID=A0A7I8IZP1_SPIIN|nr:unnamed protein product [Spirodela intermedia]CAA6663436.1 unnamed protein product [Spirodela intermedia]